jgi:hypothetical protein
MRDGLITLIFVDWLPPFTYTSRGFLSLGSEVALDPWVKEPNPYDEIPNA